MEMLLFLFPKGKNPLSTSLEEAIELIKEKQKADAPIAHYEDKPVTKGKGRFGPFIKWNEMFINVNKKYDFDHLSQVDIETLIEDKKRKEAEKVIHNWETEGIRVEKARWGRSNILRENLKLNFQKILTLRSLLLKKYKPLLKKRSPNPRKEKPALRKNNGF
jgi:DNA topoisomerase-1